MAFTGSFAGIEDAHYVPRIVNRLRRHQVQTARSFTEDCRHNGQDVCVWITGGGGDVDVALV
jgi:hypothetical protein